MGEGRGNAAGGGALDRAMPADAPAATARPSGEPERVATARELDAGPGDDLEAVLAAAAGGDEGAWRELVGRFGSRVYAFVVSRVRRPDVAEEVVQSVFVTVAVKLREGQYTERGRFESWLFRIAMNRLRDECRRLKRQARATDPGVMVEVMGAGRDGRPRGADGEGEGGPAGSEESMVWKLRAAMERLTPGDREIIELRHRGQVGFAALSEMLGEPVGTLLARHHRALKKLRAMLESA